MQKIIEKAGVLVEALPYIKAFQGKTFVIKYGGSTLSLSEVVKNICLDLVFLKAVGIHPVLVHGGGPEISEQMKKKGKKAVFIHGMRVTDPETMGIMVEVMGRINKTLCGLIEQGGGKAKGLLKGAVHARKIRFKEENGQAVELGRVGEVTRIDKAKFDLDAIPVVSPVGVGEDGGYYNINADTVACEVASSLKAQKLVFLTDVQGIQHGSNLLSSLHENGVESLVRQGVISGGMLPKVKACLHALERGVQKTHIIDGRVMHSILLEIFTDAGIGTEIVK